jgi:serine/threonine protein kinase
VQPGQIVAGKYRIENVLGRGGMGVVVSATHLTLDQLVAIKFLKPEACGNATAVARIMREARTVSQMETEHVARVLDCGLAEGTPFLVMELLHGRSLARELTLRGSLTVTEVCDYLVQACDAIGEAHALGIVHRDLKPGNLFLARRRGGVYQIKVLDFGLSKVLTARALVGEASLTDAHSLLGTPLYVSPEQLRSSKEVDARTDVWSLGLILYQLLTGYTPFYARSIPKLFAQIARDPIQPLRELRPDVPAGLDAVAQRCLAKASEDRFANAAELGLALAEFVTPPVALLDRLRSFAGRAIVRSLQPSAAPCAERNDAENAQTPDRHAVESHLVDGHSELTTARSPGASTTTTRIESSGMRHRWSRRILFVVASATPLAILGGLHPWWRELILPAPSQSGASSAPLDGRAPPAGHVPLRLVATPSRARLFVDGRELAQNPFSGTLERSNVQHLVRAEAAGYEPVEHTVTSQQAVNLELHLRPLTPAASARPTPSQHTD